MARGYQSTLRGRGLGRDRAREIAEVGEPLRRAAPFVAGVEVSELEAQPQGHVRVRQLQHVPPVRFDAHALRRARAGTSTRSPAAKMLGSARALRSSAFPGAFQMVSGSMPCRSASVLMHSPGWMLYEGTGGTSVAEHAARCVAREPRAESTAARARSTAEGTAARARSTAAAADRHAWTLALAPARRVDVKDRLI